MVQQTIPAISRQQRICIASIEATGIIPYAGMVLFTIIELKILNIDFVLHHRLVLHRPRNLYSRTSELSSLLAWSGCGSEDGCQSGNKAGRMQAASSGRRR